MKDVADHAGVSKQTVSAIINGKPGITRETQQRVLDSIKQLGYRPHAVARSLATGRTQTLALLAADLSAPFIGKLALAAEDAAQACGYNLVVYNTHDDVEKEMAYFRNAVDRGVDGILFISATDQHHVASFLAQEDIPAVSIDRVPYPYTGPSVTLDNVKAGRLACEHLVSLGHQRIAHITGPQSVLMSRERALGVRQVLEAHQLDTLLRLEPAAGWGYQDGHNAMQRLLSEGPRPTAVFTAGDALAIGAMRAICASGLSVPRDISVVGVDDIDSAAYQNPPLTTVRQSITELANLAVNLLYDILQGKEPPERQVVMEPVLVVRESTAAPAI
ncbi:MAG: LacI family transcriptional regulator [Chloroflexi bacterium]|nr:LacI family transcriptional regulator [Chloroflexota bacterium]